jgi:hypothetical protein
MSRGILAKVGPSVHCPLAVASLPARLEARRRQRRAALGSQDSAVCEPGVPRQSAATSAHLGMLDLILRTAAVASGYSMVASGRNSDNHDIAARKALALDGSMLARNSSPRLCFPARTAATNTDADVRAANDATGYRASMHALLRSASSCTAVSRDCSMFAKAARPEPTALVGQAPCDRTQRGGTWCPTTVSDAAWRGRDGGAKGDNGIGARSADRRKQMAVGCIQRLGCTWRRMVTA